MMEKMHHEAAQQPLSLARARPEKLCLRKLAMTTTNDDDDDDERNSTSAFTADAPRILYPLPAFPRSDLSNACSQ